MLDERRRVGIPPGDYELGAAGYLVHGFRQEGAFCLWRAALCYGIVFQAFETAKADAEGLLQMLNDFLLTQTFLVGERLSLADINMAFAILPAYQHVSCLLARSNTSFGFRCSSRHKRLTSTAT